MSSYYKYISNRPAHDPRKCRRHFHLAACRFRSANIRLPQIGLPKSDRLLDDPIGWTSCFTTWVQGFGIALRL